MSQVWFCHFSMTKLLLFYKLIHIDAQQQSFTTQYWSDSNMKRQSKVLYQHLLLHGLIKAK